MKTLPGYSEIIGCRVCQSEALLPILNLPATPLANALLPFDSFDTVSQLYPLELVRCPNCTLIQIRQSIDPAILFSEYPYFASYSLTRLRLAENLATMLIGSERLDDDSLVIEVGSNDGYLLQFFSDRSIPVLGIDPASNIAQISSESRAIPTIVDFFSRPLAQGLVDTGRGADVIIANNVLAHAADLNGFISGVSCLLKPHGVAVFEVPYLIDMIDNVEFDTIYHEHRSYFSLTSLRGLLSRHDMQIHNVDRIQIHGGSIRVYASHIGDRSPSEVVPEMLADEDDWGVFSEERYKRFSSRVGTISASLSNLLGSLRSEGKRIAGYGAAAKGVTLLASCDLDGDTLEFLVDHTPYKQGKRFAIDAIPIYPVSELDRRHPDYVLILAWNFAEEIVSKHGLYRERGGKFICPLPTLEII